MILEQVLLRKNARSLRLRSSCGSVFSPQGLNIVEFHAVYFFIKWHLGFTKTLRRLRDRKYTGLHMWDQEEEHEWS